MTNVEGKVPMSTKTKIGWLAAVILPAMILLVPESEALTLQIKLFLAVTLCAILIFALELMDNVIPALMLPLCYYALKLVPLTTAFQPWTTTIPWMCLGGFILTNIMLRTGLLKRVAYWCIVKTGGTYKGIIWGLIFFGIVFNLVKPGASFVAMSAFAYGLCTALGLGRSKAAAGIMIAASFATLVPGYFIYTPANVGMLLGIGASVTDTAVTYFEFMKHNIVFIPFIFIMAWLLTKMFKPEKPIDGKAFFLEEQRKLGKMSKDELKTAIAMIALFLCMLTNIVDIGFAFVVIPCPFVLPRHQCRHERGYDQDQLWLFDLCDSVYVHRFCSHCLRRGQNDFGDGAALHDQYEHHRHHRCSLYFGRWAELPFDAFGGDGDFWRSADPISCGSGHQSHSDAVHLFLQLGSDLAAV